MMHSTSLADEIVSCARSWIGTRFVHQGRLKKTDTHPGGVDCLGLLIGVAKELDLRDAQGTLLWQLDQRNYSRTPDIITLHAALYRSLIPQKLEEAVAGDIALFHIQNSPQHLGMLALSNTGGLSVIHAYAQARKVVEHALDEYWMQKLVSVFRLP